MTSPRRRQDRVIESIELKITFRPDKATWTKVKESVPIAVLKGADCEIKIEGGSPGEVEDRARVVLEKLRDVVEHKPKRDRN